MTARGFTHDVLAVAFVVIFAISGVAYLVASHADTLQFGITAHGNNAKLVINGAYSGNTASDNLGTDVFGNEIVPVMESPPWIASYNASNGWSSFLLSSAQSVACNTPGNLTSGQPIDCTGGSGVAPHLQTSNGMELYTANSVPVSYLFRRNYSAAFAGQTVLRSGTYYRVTVDHAENKNDIAYNGGNISQPGTGNNYQTTVKTGNLAWNPANKTGCSEDDFSSGTCQNTTTPWYSNTSYSGFITSSIAPESANNNWGNETMLTNQGPIVWPELGYGPDTTGITSFKYMGVRHPYSLVVGNYMYVYYLDTSGNNATTGDGSGADTGIKVARSPLTSLGDMGSWDNYDSANGKWDLPSTPPSMNINNVSSYLNKPGPQESPLWSSSPATGGYVPVAFQVASIANNPNKYIGVETEYNNAGGWRAELRYSSNLVTWSSPLVIPSTAGAGNINGETSGELFSILLSADGSSNSVLSSYNSSNHSLPVYVESSISSVPYTERLSLQLP